LAANPRWVLAHATGHATGMRPGVRPGRGRARNWRVLSHPLDRATLGLTAVAVIG